MLEYIQFYTKNLSNFTILLLIGVSIAILDITLRNVVRGVYLNVRENMKLRHGGGGREGMTATKDAKDAKDAKTETADKDAKDATSKEDDEACQIDCTAVEALRTKLTGLIENAAKLQKDIQENDETIKKQHKTIENMQKSIQKLIDKSK
jgi:uncharacterized protein YoxC